MLFSSDTTKGAGSSSMTMWPAVWNSELSQVWEDRRGLTCSVISHCKRRHSFHFTCIPLLFAVACCDVPLCSILTCDSRSSKKWFFLKSWPWSYSAFYRQLQAERCHATGICHLPIWWCKYFICPVFQFSSAQICLDPLVVVFVVFQTPVLPMQEKKKISPVLLYFILFIYFPVLITSHGHITVRVKPFADMNRQDLDSIIDILHWLCWGCEFSALFLHQHNVNLTVESYEVKDQFKPDLSISDLLFHMHFFQATCRKLKN